MIMTTDQKVGVRIPPGSLGYQIIIIDKHVTYGFGN